jgi:hypothetical protein
MHAAILEDKLSGFLGMQPHLLLDAADAKTRRSLFDDEGAMAGAAQVLVERRENDHPGGARPIGDEALRSVQHVVVAIRPGRGADIGDVRSRSRLGQPVCAVTQHAVVLEHAEEASLLFRCAGRRDRWSAQSGSRNVGQNRGVGPCQLFRQEHGRAVVLALFACTARVAFFAPTHHALAGADRLELAQKVIRVAPGTISCERQWAYTVGREPAHHLLQVLLCGREREVHDGADSTTPDEKSTRQARAPHGAISSATCSSPTETVRAQCPSAGV